MYKIMLGLALASMLALIASMQHAASAPAAVPQLSPTASPFFCPLPTPPPLWVDPVASPTDQLSQTIRVYAGSAMTVTVQTESGSFTQTQHTGNQFFVPITLYPNTTHHLQVRSYIAQRTVGECTYPAFSLSTTRDTQGQELIIVQQTSGISTPVTTPHITPTPTGTPTLCPIPTPQPLWVEPVDSPTTQLSQTIYVQAGSAMTVTIQTESGVFTETGSSPFAIPISLLPNTTHHLTVTSYVPAHTAGGCTFGGYSLSTTRDSQGDPLTIIQQSTNHLFWIPLWRVPPIE